MKILHAVASVSEHVISRRCGIGTLLLLSSLLLGCASRPDAIQYYSGFGTREEVIVEGRVTEASKNEEAAADDSRRRNIYRTARLFNLDECEHCPIELELNGTARVASETDDEGFFRAALEPGAGTGFGWQSLVLNSGDLVSENQALIISPANSVGIVSDVDDTVLVTEVIDRMAMLGNTFARNPLQRDVVPGMARLYAETLAVNPEPEASAMFYLSSSPRELHGYFEIFLALHEFPRGVLATRRFTLDRSSDPKFDSRAYKIARLADIFERSAGVRFILVGDDGEHDPEVYDEIRRQFPDRVVDIWIRRVNPDRSQTLPDGQKNLATVLNSVDPT